MDLQPLLERRERREPDWRVHYKGLITLLVSVICLMVEIWFSKKSFPIEKVLECYGPLLLMVISYIASVILLVFTFMAKEGDYFYVPFLKYVGEELYQNMMIWSEEVLPKFRTMFLADILTSTIKMWVDVGSFICQSVCAMMPLGSVCGGVYATIGDCTRFMILLLPSLIRLIQSIRLLFCGIDIGTHGGNAVKYFIAVAVVVLSALRFFYSESRTIFITWIIFCALNSVLCSIWDVLMDWDLRHFAEAFHVNSLNFWYQLLFGWKLAYIWAAGSNAILRCTLLWSYKLLKKSDKFVFMITTLEIFRRFQFTVFRVVKMWTQLPPADQGVQVPPPTEVPPQLPPADHGVQIPPPADHGVQVPPPAKVPPQLPPADHGVQVPPPSEVPPQLPPVDHGVQVPLPAEVPPQLPPADIPPPQPADNNAINQGGGENGGAQPIHHN